VADGPPLVLIEQFPAVPVTARAIFVVLGEGPDECVGVLDERQHDLGIGLPVRRAQFDRTVGGGAGRRTRVRRDR